MRIQHNIAALNAHRQLTTNNNATAKSLEKLSSGYRINRAGDDAAGLAISEKMRSQITGLSTAQKNANDGISLIQTAEGALTEVHSMLNRMVEIATQAANGVYENGIDRTNLNAELTSLKSEIDRIGATTDFNNKKILNGGADSSLSFQVGTSSAAANQISITINATSSAQLGLTAVSISNQATAKSAMDTINTAINTVSTQRGNLGAIQNRLEHTVNNLGTTEENITASESRIRDVDMAKEMMTYTKNNILVQASQSMLAQANQQPQGVLQLLQ